MLKILHFYSLQIIVLNCTIVYSGYKGENYVLISKMRRVGLSKLKL